VRGLCRAKWRIISPVTPRFRVFSRAPQGATHPWRAKANCVVGHMQPIHKKHTERSGQYPLWGGRYDCRFREDGP
jgi:hypothetical protein